MSKPKEGDEKSSNAIAQAILDIVSRIPASAEVEPADPHSRAAQVVLAAAIKAGAVSGAMSLAPGPWGLATILPDLYTVWRIQAQMVADIAAIFGKSALLGRRLMLYCLFRHAAAHVFGDLVSRIGERIIFRRATLRVLQSIARRLGVRITQRLIAQSVARWLPFVGSAGMAGYVYWETTKVGETAIELFSKSVEAEADDDDLSVAAQ